MFSDKSFDDVGFSSCWKTERSSQNAEAQTQECSYQENAIQTVISDSKETQTDNAGVDTKVATDVDYDKLASFLNRICPSVLGELDKINKSHAFDGYEQIDDDSESGIKKLHTLQSSKGYPQQKKLKVSGLAWSCTGSVVAMGYSQQEHEDWCDHHGTVHLFNIDRQDFSPSSPSKILETTSCVTSLSAHPVEPSILAAGTFSGEVVVWNLQKDDDCVLGSSAVIPGAHRDEVTQVSWIRNPDPTQQRPLLATTGCDGRMLLWQVGSHSGSFRIDQGFIITLEHFSHRRAKLQSPLGVTGSELGITCFSFTIEDPSSFIVGVEGGGLLRCSTLTSKPVTGAVKYEIPMKDPVLSSYENHEGSVTCVQCSEHHPNIFLSCGTDNEIRIYNINQPVPIQVIHTNTTMIGLEWWSLQPYVFATWGTAGAVEFYNVHNGDAITSLKLIESDKPQPISSMHFNPHSARLVATGDTQGKVVIWHVPVPKISTKME